MASTTALIHEHMIRISSHPVAMGEGRGMGAGSPLWMEDVKKLALKLKMHWNSQNFKIFRLRLATFTHRGGGGG